MRLREFLFSTILVLFSAGALIASTGNSATEKTGSASGIKNKIEASIYQAFEDQFAQKVDQESAGVRVIAYLNPLPAGQMRAVNTTEGLQDLADNVTDTQNEFIGLLQREGLLGGEEGRGAAADQFRIELLLEYQHAVAMTVPSAKMVETLAGLPGVQSVGLDRLNELFTVEGRSLTGSTSSAAAGDTGAGVGVAVIDSHFDLLHPELGGSNTMPNGIMFGGSNFSNPGTPIYSQSFNDCYHGTGTASIVRRYAPGVSLYGLTVFPNAFDSVISSAINWCITNKNGVGGGSPIKIISMSLGGGQYSSTCNSGAMHTAAGTALANGILVFAASGNDGWASSMSSPACSDNVISIGSVWDANGAAYTPFSPAFCSDSSRLADERACYSNKSSILDLYAPSEEVICARCGTGGTWALGGTSSACPAAAGLTAQLLDNHGTYAGNKSGVVSLFQSTGAVVTGDTGKRRIALAAALASLGGGTTPTATFTASPASITSGQSATLSWTTTNATSCSINQGVGSVTPVGSGSVSVSPTATTTYTLTVTGSGGTITRTATVTVTTSGSGSLANGVTQSLTLATGATQNYTIAIPANASNLVVTITGNGDLDLYVKDSPINWPSEQGAHNTATFKAPYIGGSSESVTFPSPAAGTWYALVHGYSGGTGTITASWTVSTGGTPQWNYVSFVQNTPHNYANNQTYEFIYEKIGATSVAVHFTTLNTEANYDFVYVYDQNNNLIFTESGNKISSGSGSAFGTTNGWAVVSGNKIRIRLVTDGSVTRYGWRTDQAAYYQ